METKLNNDEAQKIVDFALQHGILNLDDVQNQLNKKRKKELLAQHAYKIWQGSDSRYRTYIDDSTKPSGRKLIVKTSEEDLTNFLVSYYEDQDQKSLYRNFSLEKIYPQWLEYKSLHTTAQNSIRRINNDWNKYYLNTDIIHVPLQNLNKLTLDTWAHRLIQKHSMTKKKYYNSTIIMRQSLDYAVDLGIIESNPFSLISIDGKKLFQKVKKKPDYTQVFLTNEIKPLAQMAWEDFFHSNRLVHKLAPLAILFQFQTGLRIGELCAVRYEDLESDNSIHIQRMFRYETNEIVEHTKTDCGDRIIPLTDLAMKYIQLAKEFQVKQGITTSYIFSINEAPLSPRSVSYLYNKYCDQMDVIRKSSHKTRKTFISALLDGKVNLNTVREIAGHADERTTLGCYCYDRNNELEKKNLITRALAV